MAAKEKKTIISTLKSLVNIVRKHLRMRIHTSEKPWSCQYCKRTFRNHRAFKDHGKKPHSCKIAVQNEEVEEKL